jgi:hypothetical protein
MGIAQGPPTDWLTVEGVQFPDDLVKASPLDVFSFFTAAGLTPEWLGRLREFAVEYLAAFRLAPLIPEGLISLYQATHEPLAQDELEALRVPYQTNPPAPIPGSTDVAMGSAEDEVDAGAQGEEGAETTQ